MLFTWGQSQPPQANKHTLFSLNAIIFSRHSEPDGLLVWGTSADLWNAQCGSLYEAARSSLAPLLREIRSLLKKSSMSVALQRERGPGNPREARRRCRYIWRESSCGRAPRDMLSYLILFFCVLLVENVKLYKSTMSVYHSFIMVEYCTGLGVVAFFVVPVSNSSLFPCWSLCFLFQSPTWLSSCSIKAIHDSSPDLLLLIEVEVRLCRWQNFS